MCCGVRSGGVFRRDEQIPIGSSWYANRGRSQRSVMGGTEKSPLQFSLQYDPLVANNEGDSYVSDHQPDHSAPRVSRGP